MLLQLLTEESAPRGTARRSAGLRRKRNERKHQFATRVLKKDKGDKSAETAPATPSEEAPPTAGGEAAPTA